MKKIFTAGIIVSALFFVQGSYGQNCGTERWDVKTLTDKDTVNINFGKKVKTTVAKQARLKKPVHPIGEDLSRLASETTYYSLDCWLIEYKKEDDKDIHIVLKDLSCDSTIVAEIPSHLCEEIVHTSHYLKIKKLNEWFEAKIGKPTSKFKIPPTPLKVHIEGIGYFDKIHGQRGMAANGREIHPVLVMKVIQ
jgi:hypothetical protein